MYEVRYGGKAAKPYRLAESKEMVAVRTYHRQEISTDRAVVSAGLSEEAWKTLDQFEPVVYFQRAGVQIFKPVAQTAGKSLRDKARTVLKRQKEVRFAGRVLMDAKSECPVLYTENFFVQFEAHVAESTCKRILKAQGLEMKRPLPYARNAYFAQAPEGTGVKVFDIAEKLLGDDKVLLCNPELVRESRRRGAFPQQWHLKKTTIGGTVVDQSANVEAAWSLATGEGVTIAIIDDGVDLDHEEFRTSGKIVAPRDVTFGTNNPRPGDGDRHGTACAGVACGDGNFGASGVAPRAKLIPIRLASELGSQNEADAFVWAAQNGADVISCSWGPFDGDFRNPNDPLHTQNAPLPDSTRLAIDFAATQGRGGKGCVVLFAAGNGNESVDLDGYASHSNVIAVAACNDKGKKSPYSDFGKAVWCSFPSNNFFASVTTGIWTTDNMGRSGYNPGDANRGDAAGNYTNTFGGTSSACPGAAGVAALVISRNKDLRREQVRDILKESCERIDTAGGNYDATGHSDFYGFGRLNARKAVELAAPPVNNQLIIVTKAQDVTIADLGLASLSLDVGGSAKIGSIKITVDIEHTYIGDLEVSLKPPAGAAITLHDREGGATDNIRRSYDKASTPALGALTGQAAAGAWKLTVKDLEAVDTGKLRSFTVEIQPQ
jgi:subtilisin family serine protease